MNNPIRNARLKAGKNNGCQFARELGISRQYLAMLETGKANNPSRELMIKMSKSLNTSIQELFFSDEK